MYDVCVYVSTHMCVHVQWGSGRLLAKHRKQQNTPEQKTPSILSSRYSTCHIHTALHPLHPMMHTALCSHLHEDSGVGGDDQRPCEIVVAEVLHHNEVNIAHQHHQHNHQGTPEAGAVCEVYK